MLLNWSHYDPPDGPQNSCHGKHSFRVFGRNLFNRMMNTFGSWLFIAIIGEIYSLVWNGTSHLYFSAAETISLFTK